MRNVTVRRIDYGSGTKIRVSMTYVIFYCPLILPCILKTTYWMNITSYLIILLDFSLTVKAATLIFISGRG